MIRLAANLSMLFTEHDFLNRFAAIGHVQIAGVPELIALLEKHS